MDYPDVWLQRLSTAHKLSAPDLLLLHADYGRFLGSCCKEFLATAGLRAELISSHGHTVFHEPAMGFTCQVGDGNVLAAEVGINTVYDYRTMDVAFGGQGAPLVPIGDEYLFGEYGTCLNLGGIANVSFATGGKRLAHDVCPFNLLLNYYAQREGYTYDPEGGLATSGQTDTGLLHVLTQLPYYQIKGPKSLDKEKLMTHYTSIIDPRGLSNRDVLNTLSIHFAQEIANNLHGDKVLVTGGGAFNQFAIKKLRELCAQGLHIPSPDIVQFKEAIVFALMGYLRVFELENTLASATGASTNCCAGSLVMAPVGNL
jgi:anhydro-N-acetylmuramic acid kinase